MIRSAIVLLLAFVCGTVFPQDGGASAPVRVRTAAEMPKVASSADRFVEVVAADVPGDPVGFRLPILQFTTRLLRDVERVYQLKMPRGEPGLVIHALEGRTNDVRVVSRAQRRNRASLTRVWLPSPGYSDIEALRFAILKAYLRAWVDRSRPASARVPAAAVPDWFVLGALRGLDGGRVDDDKRAVLERWSSADLPFFPAVCRDLRAGEGRDAELCGYVVAWMKERRMIGKALEELAAGRAWEAGRLAKALTGENEPVRQDRASDERLARLTRSVLSPGRAAPWDLKVFASRLLLYAPEFDKNIGANSKSCTFREALAMSQSNLTMRVVAARKAREMPFCAIGRGPALAETSEAYRLFLTGLARGEGPETLGPMLDKAELRLEEMLNEDRKDDNR